MLTDNSPAVLDLSRRDAFGIFSKEKIILEVLVGISHGCWFCNLDQLICGFEIRLHTGQDYKS
jgi:hypothetical protein